MSIASWIFTLSLHAVILTILYHRKWALVWFPATLIAVLGEAVVIAQFLIKFGIESPHYYNLVVTFDLFNALLYMICIYEAWKKHATYVLAPLAFFLVCKMIVFGLGTHSFDWWQAGKQVLIYVNMACVIFWAGALTFVAPRKEQQL